jgi:hypothetical protein
LKTNERGNTWGRRNGKGKEEEQREEKWTRIGGRATGEGSEESKEEEERMNLPTVDDRAIVMTHKRAAQVEKTQRYKRAGSLPLTTCVCVCVCGEHRQLPCPDIVKPNFFHGLDEWSKQAWSHFSNKVVTIDKLCSLVSPAGTRETDLLLLLLIPPRDFPAVEERGVFFKSGALPAPGSAS